MKPALANTRAALLPLVSLLGALRAGAQTPQPNSDQVVTLTPFQVQADSDSSYGALNSNSVTNFNTELNRLPLSADIFDEAFIRDTNSQTVEQMLQNFSAGAGYSSAGGDPGGLALQPGDRNSATGALSLRGLGSTTMKQDGLLPPSPVSTTSWSTFALERVEVIMGPQALLYGNGGAGGVINFISKQARLGQPAFGSVRFQVDQYGDKTGEFDYGMSAGNAAVYLSTINQEFGGRRTNIGGPMQGYYAQLAAKLFGNTVIRVSAKQLYYYHLENVALALNAGSAAVDARNGDTLHYLLATNQVGASASGPSGAGAIDNGNLNWSNVDSFGGDTKSEFTTGLMAEFAAETTWTPWLSTQLALGYANNTDRYDANGTSFYSPTASSNPLPGNWTMGGAYLVSNEPSTSKAIRFSALATNDLFGGRAHSQTILGGDFLRTNQANIQSSYYQADANWNVLYNSTSATYQNRTVLPTPAWAVNNGPVEYALWTPGTPRVNYGGTNYVFQLENPAQKSLVTPANPQGVPTLGGGFYLQSFQISRGLYGTNYTQWFGDKFDTLVGFRAANAYYYFANQTPPAQLEKSSAVNFDVGIDYKLTSWLRPYLSASDSYNLPGSLITFTASPYGIPPPIAHGVGEEAGLKFSTDGGLISGSLAVYHVKSENTQFILSSTLLNDINPSGLDGRYGASGFGGAGAGIAVNEDSRGAQLTLTASPLHNLRMRLSAGYTAGTIGNSTSYAQLYNDQFHEDSAGNVTYANGTPVYVAGAATSAASAKEVAPGTAGAVPLTVALMNNPASLYYANPVTVTGQVNAGSNVGKILITPLYSNTNGPILTGQTGLPISQIQINPGAPLPGTIVTTTAGQVTTGYPEWAANFTSVYTLPSGWAKGFEFGGTLNLAWKRYAYYYYVSSYTPTTPRRLFDWPDMFRFDGILGYSRKFRRVTWLSQLNIANMFNRYHVVIMPNAITGYPGVDDATFDQQPRAYTWTNTFSF